jgi:hypothetical protein
MNVILRNSTRRMIDQSRASVEAEGFIAWLRTDGYTDYVIDCHVRRLLFVLPKLSSGTEQPTLREVDLLAVFGRERRPLTRFTNFASTRRGYSRYLRAQGRLITEPGVPKLRLKSKSACSPHTALLSDGIQALANVKMCKVEKRMK